MPEVYPVTSQGFVKLLTDLGIQVRPSFPLWYLSDTVSPVSIVNSQVTLAATIAPASQIWSTAGPVVAPVNGTILADTGALPEGRHKFLVVMSAIDNVNLSRWRVAHRNAANAADLKSHDVGQQTGAGQSVNFSFEFTVQIALNERVRVVQTISSSANGAISASVFHNLLP